MRCWWCSVWRASGMPELAQTGTTLPEFYSSAEVEWSSGVTTHTPAAFRDARSMTTAAVLQAFVPLISLFTRARGQTSTETIAAFRSRRGKNSIPRSGLPAAHCDVSPVPSPGVWCHFPSIDRSVAGRMSSSCSPSLGLCCLSLCLSSIKSMCYLSEVFTSV